MYVRLSPTDKLAFPAGQLQEISNLTSSNRTAERSKKAS